MSYNNRTEGNGGEMLISISIADELQAQALGGSAARKAGFITVHESDEADGA